MNHESIKQFLKPDEKKIAVSFFLGTFIFLWMLAAKIKFYYFLAAGAVIYIYSCELKKKLDEGKIRSAWQLALDLCVKMVLAAMVIAAFHFLRKV
jgi:hypothetical protein